MDPMYFCLMHSSELQHRWASGKGDNVERFWEIMSSADDCDECVGFAIDILTGQPQASLAVAYFHPVDGVGVVWRDGSHMHACLASITKSEEFQGMLATEMIKRYCLLCEIPMTVKLMINY